MAKSRLVCVLALIFIDAVCAEMNPESGDNNLPPEEMEKAIFELPKTGKMDGTTGNIPRCNQKDDSLYPTLTRWPTHFLTWRIRKYSQTSRLSKAEQRHAIKRGLYRWADVTQLEFRETESKPDIDIAFERMGGSVEVGCANGPPYGDVYLNDDETWVNGNIGGIDLESAAAHEFGQALGLPHTNDTNHLMARFNRTYPDDFKLHRGDVASIQSLYGKKLGVSDGFCGFTYNHIDASMRVNGYDVVFVDNGQVIDGRNGQRMDIKELFPGGPSRVHAAVYYGESAFLFEGERVWTYTHGYNEEFSLVYNFPRLISNKWSHNPETAIHYDDGYIVLLKDEHLFEFSTYDADVVWERPFRVNRAFRNIPRRVDATVVSSNDIYFIVNKVAYQMPKATRKVSTIGIPSEQAFSTCGN